MMLSRDESLSMSGISHRGLLLLPLGLGLFAKSQLDVLLGRLVVPRKSIVTIDLKIKSPSRPSRKVKLQRSNGPETLPVFDIRTCRNPVSPPNWQSGSSERGLTVDLCCGPSNLRVST